MNFSPAGSMPRAQGLYDPSFEHDACGVAFVATLDGIPSHAIVAKAITALENLDHRGASGSEPDSGDGAGILTQVPDEFFRGVVEFELPEAGRYAVGTAFLPAESASEARAAIEAIAQDEGLTVLGWRELPVNATGVGATAQACMPTFWQLFVSEGTLRELALDRRVYGLRKRAKHELGVYFASLSARTIVYKGMLTTNQLKGFFPDLTDPHYLSAIGLVHSRFSTNTFPSWPLAHPYRLIAHKWRNQHGQRQSQLDDRPRSDAHI